MLQPTRGIMIRTVKYGESSLICSVFTERYGVCSYMVQGVRSSKKGNRAGLLQVGTLLDIVSEHKPGRQLQRLREFQPAYIYTSMQEDIVRNSIALFSVELLQRLLPQEEPLPELFDFCFDYFCQLDRLPLTDLANLPLFFIARCGKLLGYNLLGQYSQGTPHLNAAEGTFAADPALSGLLLEEGDAAALALLLELDHPADTASVSMNAGRRNRLLDWYIAFLRHHTQHLGALRSPEILRMILH